MSLERDMKMRALISTTVHLRRLQPSRSLQGPPGTRPPSNPVTRVLISTTVHLPSPTYRGRWWGTHPAPADDAFWACSLN